MQKKIMKITTTLETAKSHEWKRRKETAQVKYNKSNKDEYPFKSKGQQKKKHQRERVQWVGWSLGLDTNPPAAQPR